MPPLWAHSALAIDQVALIFLLTLYVMSEKTMPTLFSPNNRIMMEIETQVM